jgi:Protein of unknown function (DUF2815)
MADEAKIMLTNVRLAFPELGDPKDYQGNKRFRWSATALVPYGSPQRAMVEKALLAVAVEKWGKKGQALYEACIGDKQTTCWLDGKKKPDYDGFEGHFALTAHRPMDKGRPIVFDKDKSPIYKPDNTLYEGKAGRLYAGMFVNFQCRFWAQDNANGKALRAELLGVQAFKDGDAFGGGAAPDPDAFAEVTEGADADDLA